MKSNYHRISRLVVLPDYQGIGVGKRLLNFLAELYTSQIDLPFYILTTNPQLVHGDLSDWKVKRIGHVSGGRNDSRINREIRSSISKNRLTVTLQYIPKRRAGGDCIS
jgi:GNAT superfamily N-acetyltransferase